MPHRHDSESCADVGRFTFPDKIKQMPSRLDNFIYQVELKYGVGKFTFELTKYVNKRHQVRVTCVEHGPFTTSPIQLLRGDDCIDCIIDRKNRQWSAEHKMASLHEDVAELLEM